MEKTNVYQMVTDRIVEQLEKGIIPWHRPWSGACLADGGAISYVTRKPYSIINQFLLGREGEYLTFNQVKQLGGSVKKGAKAGMVVFFTIAKHTETEVVDDDGTAGTVRKVKETKFPILRYYHVFHIDDTVGIPSRVKASKPEPTLQPVEAAENVINGYLARETGLTFVNDRLSNEAYYSPSDDSVHVPMLSQYQIVEEYYSTTFHELVHSTKKKSRCDRDGERTGIAAFGNENYSREELVAEIGSAMLCNSVGLDCEKSFRNQVAYINGWLSKLKNDNHAIVWASSRAEKAARYIIGETE